MRNFKYIFSIIATFAIFLAFFVLAKSVYADPNPLTGAIFTTDSGCGGVNINLYNFKTDVYLNGGPNGGGQGLTDGSYYVQITDPSGAHVLGTSSGASVHVTNGNFDTCYKLIDIAPPFSDTTNPGDEYKVWVSPDPDFAHSKTDNFKVRGNLVVIKHVINDNGGTANAGDFTINVTGINVSDNSFPGDESGTRIALDNGPYTISETNLPGYLGSASADCVGTIGAGQTKTCTITNDDIAPILHLRKVVINDNGGQATVANFTLSADGAGSNDISGTSPVDSGTTLKADTFALSETNLAGYSASDWVCVGGNQNGSNITLGLAQEATCTITNDDIAPKLHLRKVVINDNGGTATTDNFTLTADGTGTNDLSGTSPVDSGDTLQADTFALSETNVTGYAASAWNCVGGVQDGSNVTVGIGQEATCTITNDDVGPSLTIVKVATPKDCQNFTFSGSLGSFQLDDDQGINDCTDSDQPNLINRTNLVANHDYTITETEPDSFWFSDSISCVDGSANPFSAGVTGTSLTVNMPLAANITCTFVNKNQAPTRTLGFWQTHTQYTSGVFTAKFSSGMQIGSGSHKGIITNILAANGSQLFGAFYAPIPKTTAGTKRSAVDQARIQLLQQLVAAKLNCAAFGCPASIVSVIATADSNYANGTAAQILASAGILDSYNNSGDTLIIGNAGSATPQTSKLYANLVFWNTP